MTDTPRLVTPTSADVSEATCPRCAAGDVHTSWRNESFQYGSDKSAVTLTARIPVRQCQTCGFEFTDHEADTLMHDAVCRHLRVQTPSEVVAIRKMYDMTRLGFAELTKFGEATLGRWERGALIQNAANDQFLYLLRFAENVDRLRTRNAGAPDSEERKITAEPTLRVISQTIELRQRAAAFSLRKSA